jgi:DNA mismatch endonuclease (patch repair protein)
MLPPAKATRTSALQDEVLVSARRSRNMARVRGKDTKPEMVVRRMLHALGYRFRLHRSDLPGCPDIVFPSRRKVIFVHGCFWHQHRGCPKAKLPKTRRLFWETKLSRNKIRDGLQIKELNANGWDVLVVWECQLTDLAVLTRRLQCHLIATIPSMTAGQQQQVRD